MPDTQHEAASGRGLFCRLGIHRWTRIPRNVVALAAQAGETKLPNWGYSGRTVRPWCFRCGAER